MAKKQSKPPGSMPELPHPGSDPGVPSPKSWDLEDWRAWWKHTTLAAWSAHFHPSTALEPDDELWEAIAFARKHFQRIGKGIPTGQEIEKAILRYRDWTFTFAAAEQKRRALDAEVPQEGLTLPESLRHDAPLSIDDVAKYLKVSRSTVYRYVNDAELPARRLPLGRGMRFFKHEIDKWIKRHHVEEWEKPLKLDHDND